MRAVAEYGGLPGYELVEAGARALADGEETPEAMLVALSAARLRAAGVDVPATGPPRPWHRLYDLLAEQDSTTAHSSYNALLRQVASFARAAERAQG